MSVLLSSLCTLELGGPAREFRRVVSEDELEECLDTSPVLLLGGGSNLIFHDDGFDGRVIQLGLDTIERSVDGDTAVYRVGAGLSWHRFVEQVVDDGTVGLECLGGIPGTVGATPVQNVGAYGQEVSEVIQEVRAYDRQERGWRVLSAPDCQFAYRNSGFKQNPGRYVITQVTFRLARSERMTPRYAELQRMLGPTARPSDAFQEVLALRRKKSMVVEPDDPNRRSVGSFFMNPMVDHLRERKLRAQLGSTIPSYPLPDGRFKIPAAFLIEAAGFRKGQRQGQVGISSKHALALVHHGGGSSAEYLRFARQIRDEVETQFSVRLGVEPTIMGTKGPDDALFNQ